jgi:chromosome partitioning protein
LEIPSSGVFSRADAQLLTIFDEEMNKAYKIKDRRNDFLKIFHQILIYIPDIVRIVCYPQEVEL